jgi:hypothetical protein
MMTRELMAVECTRRSRNHVHQIGESGGLAKVIPASSGKEAAQRGSPGNAREKASLDSRNGPDVVDAAAGGPQC